MSTLVAHFQVLGTPAPQGSKKIVGRPGQRGRLVESSKQVEPWRAAVAWEARSAIGNLPPLDEPLELVLHFHLRPPASASKKQLAYGPMRKPDIDKLVRSTMDGLTDGGLWADDARVVKLVATKRYTEPAYPAPGVHVEVWSRAQEVGAPCRERGPRTGRSTSRNDRAASGQGGASQTNRQKEGAPISGAPYVDPLADC
jgi:crossover junction endodeoxyribonuclease RusA